jgi:hypothetical protein
MQFNIKITKSSNTTALLQGKSVIYKKLLHVSAKSLSSGKVNIQYKEGMIRLRDACLLNKQIQYTKIL